MAHCVLVHAGMAHCFLCVQVNVLETQHSVLVKNIKSSDDIELVLELACRNCSEVYMYFSNITSIICQNNIQ